MKVTVRLVAALWLAALAVLGGFDLLPGRRGARPPHAGPRAPRRPPRRGTQGGRRARGGQGLARRHRSPAEEVRAARPGHRGVRPRGEPGDGDAGDGPGAARVAPRGDRGDHVRRGAEGAPDPRRPPASTSTPPRSCATTSPPARSRCSSTPPTSRRAEWERWQLQRRPLPRAGARPLRSSRWLVVRMSITRPMAKMARLDPGAAARPGRSAAARVTDAEPLRAARARGLACSPGACSAPRPRPRRRPRCG